MKRMLLSCAMVLLCAGWLQAQLEEDFTPNPPGWTLANGYSIHPIGGNDMIASPSSNGSTQAVVGTPIVKKTSNTLKVCFDMFAYDANLSTKMNFPCATYVNLYFVRSSVNNGNDITPQNSYDSIVNIAIPAAGGTLCNTFNFPAGVPASDFRMFLTIHTDNCSEKVRYVLDNFLISGLSAGSCSDDNCAPVALPDVFNFIIPTKFTDTLVLYGGNTAYPAPLPGYKVDTTGTDDDANDTYTHLKWSLRTAPANGTVIVNDSGTAIVTRADLTVTLLQFVYQLCDDGVDDVFGTSDDLCDTAVVTINYPAGATLPISMVNFNASRNGLNVMLTWTTTIESNNAGFEIQRGTGDGSYTTIGYVASKANNGNSTGTLQYQFNEMNSSNAMTWYRIVQIDKDGIQKIYPARAVRGLEDLKKMLIYPNPGTFNNLNVLFGSAGVRDIIVTDVNGKIVKRWNNYRDDNLSIYGLQTGMYMLFVHDRTHLQQWIEKILITK